MIKRPEILTPLALREEAQRLYANPHSQRAFLVGCEHVLAKLGYSKGQPIFD